MMKIPLWWKSFESYSVVEGFTQILKFSFTLQDEEEEDEEGDVPAKDEL